jgi:hypothetical protein
MYQFLFWPEAPVHCVLHGAVSQSHGLCPGTLRGGVIVF